MISPADARPPTQSPSSAAQERARTRQLALTYSRQAKQYAASESMQEIMNKHAQRDEERALARQIADEQARLPPRPYCPPPHRGGSTEKGGM